VAGKGLLRHDASQTFPAVDRDCIRDGLALQEDVAVINPLELDVIFQTMFESVSCMTKP
jgi:hypothetical protein